MKGRRQFPLLWKILLSTSIAITVLLALTGWFAERQTVSVLSQSLEAEIRISFRAYEALWESRTDTLRSVSLALSNMSDVRAAFSTNDRATIRDTAEEIWSKLSMSRAAFFVTDPAGGVIASLSGDKPGGDNMLGGSTAVVRAAAPKFPRQSDGFALEAGRLFEFVVTPVYIDTPSGPGLWNVLAAGFAVDQSVASELKQRTGSDILFVAGGRVLASTLPSGVSSELAKLPASESQFVRRETSAGEFALLRSPLRSVDGRPVGDLFIVRSYQPIASRLAALQRVFMILWLGAILAGLAGSYLLGRHLLLPVRRLDEAAALIARQEYGTRVIESGNDELARLARTFNSMSQSIQQARQDLIRQERLSTIGRLSSSIIHDLRNPLAAIFGGAEMLMDGNLNPDQTRRLTANIYRSSRAIQEMLQDLASISRGSARSPEPCSLYEVVAAAVEAQSGAAEQQGIAVRVSVPHEIELPLERARMERVFLNLLSNSFEAMPEGGWVEITACQSDGHVTVMVEDNGPGIAPEVRARLFEPFSSGGKNGLGLGLALSRQTVRDHQGELWAEDAGGAAGARFHLRLPLASH
jgi:signal transduction histidine kinase